MESLEPSVLSYEFDKDDSFCYLNIYIKSRYGIKLIKFFKLKLTNYLFNKVVQ